MRERASSSERAGRESEGSVNRGVGGSESSAAGELAADWIGESSSMGDANVVSVT